MISTLISGTPVRATAAGPTGAAPSAAWRSASARASSVWRRSAAATAIVLTPRPPSRTRWTAQKSASEGTTASTRRASTRGVRIEEPSAAVTRVSASARARAVSAARRASCSRAAARWRAVSSTTTPPTPSPRGKKLASQCRRTPGSAGVSPENSISFTSAPVSSTLRSAASACTPISPSSSAGVRPMWSAAGNPLMRARASLIAA